MEYPYDCDNCSYKTKPAKLKGGEYYISCAGPTDDCIAMGDNTPKARLDEVNTIRLIHSLPLINPINSEAQRQFVMEANK